MNISGWDHYAIVARDMDACRHFYCDVLGMAEVPRPASFKFPGAWYRKGSAELHVIRIDAASQPPGDTPAEVTPELDIARARHHAFVVDDMDAVLERLREHNIEIVLGPRDRGGGVLQTYCFDPDRHLVEFISFPHA
jgi:catechol 2,3-dioxygenase-like lactoylglutathione lyase family enzyme